MNPRTTRKNSLPADEKQSVKLLIDRMGLGKKEIEEISTQYGVSAFQLVELMRYHKYQFLYTPEPDGTNSYPS